MAPSLGPEKYKDEALLLRQKELLAFLEDKAMHDLKPIVLSEPESQNILIVGDWFYAESRNPGRRSNYNHTFFTWHAPTVLARIEEFDSTFEAIRKQKGIDPRLLRRNARDRLEEIIKATEERIANK
jgi:hypothetical protein